MPQDRIGDLKKKRQQEKELDAIRASKTSKYNEVYKSALGRLERGELNDYQINALSRLSAQSADHRQQAPLERPDTPLAATPEPKRK